MASRLIVPAIFVRHDDRYCPKRKIRITIHLHKQLNGFDLMFQMTIAQSLQSLLLLNLQSRR